MRITRITRGGVYRPNSTGLEETPDSGGMDGGSELEMEFDDSDTDVQFDPMRMSAAAVVVNDRKPFRWFRSSRREMFTRQRYRFLGQLDDAEEPHVSKLDRDDDIREARWTPTWGVTRALKFHMLKRQRRRAADEAEGLVENNDPTNEQRASHQ